MKPLISTIVTFLPFLLLSTITSALPTGIDNAALIERQVGCPPAHPCTVLEGNGDPHQWILHKRISLWVDCGGTTCVNSEAQQKSYTSNAQTHGLLWTTGGFAVSDSCFDEPCKTGDETTIFHAPNTINVGVDYECVYDDDCGDQGQEVWLPRPAGGPPSPAPLVQRKGCIPAGSCTRVEDDGNPHQWTLTKQLSARKDCGDTYCVVAQEDMKDYTLDANAHGLDWISSGCNVKESVKTGFHEGCTGGGQQPSNSVCTKATVWFTDYTVRGGVANACDPDGCIKYDHTGIIRSPNAILPGGTLYSCAYDDDCAEQGHEEWVPGPASGPPWSLAKGELHNTSEATHHKPDTVLEGDGSPKQVISHRQISSTVFCDGFDDDYSCGVEESDQNNLVDLAYTPEGVDWINGGFAVAMWIPVGIMQGDALAACTAEPGESVCVFADLWYTIYTVRGGGVDFTSEIWSPNLIKDGINYVCGHNDQCGERGQEAWWVTGVAGGPL